MSLLSVDVIILGGGPAGTACAIALARSGRTVTILERSRYELPRVGEALPPEVWRPLSELRVWERFLADGPVPSPGITAVWGSAKAFDQDHILSPFGPGWHVDRRRFDGMLAEAAEAAGSEVLRGAQLTHCGQDGAGVWRIEAILDGTTVERSTSALVDATGRRAVAARRLGVRRITHDRLVGLWELVLPASPYAPQDRRTLIETVDCGWWYSALLPAGQYAVAFMTDSDLVPSGPAVREAFWRKRLKSAAHTQARVGSASIGNALRIIPAGSSRLQVMAGPRWMAVGDAAMSFDPLSSWGVTWALESGLAAAQALDAFLDGDQTSTQDFARRAARDFAHYLQERAAIYTSERRWPGSPFWQRRHAAPRASANPLILGAGPH